MIPFDAEAQGARRRPLRGGRASGKTALKVAPDLDRRLARYKQVTMGAPRGLSAREQRLVNKLVQACRYMENIYWRQSDPQGLALYRSLAGSTLPRDRKLRRLLMIYGSRFDQVDHNEPFVGTEKMPPGRGLYPEGLTREEIEKYVAQHPEKKAELYSPFTVVRRRGSELEGVPYRIAYRAFLEPAAKALREAAALSADKDFAEFLRLRAAALLSDDYLASDLKWVDLKDPRFDVVFGPYEVYLDEVLGVKTAYTGAVLIRNEAESRKLELYTKYVPDIQEALPLPAEDKPSKRGLSAPMEVMDTPYRAGDYRHGYQAVATNLPNDPEVHRRKGAKRIFFKNYMDARVNYVILPIAKRLMRPDQAAKATADGYFSGVLMHEVAHGIGPNYARMDGKQVDIREAIGPLYSALEEAKATVVGFYGLKWLIDKEVLPAARLEEYYASELAGLFRTVRFGIAEAHGRAQMMEFNFYWERKAIQRDPQGRYFVNVEKMDQAVAALARELLEIEAAGDRKRAEAWFAKYDSMPEHLRAALNSVADVPVDIDPVMPYPEPIE